MNTSSIITYDRKAITVPLKEFCSLAHDNDFIEITEWHNQDGYDIVISRKNDNQFVSLTQGDINAIIALTKII